MLHSQSATDFLASLIRQDKTRLMTLYFPHENGPDAGLLVNQLIADEQISTDFTYTITVLSDDAEIDLIDVQGKMVCVELKCENYKKRYFNGYCFEFSLLRIDSGVAIYQMVLKPWLRFFDLKKNYFIFHRLNIREQTKKIFCEMGLASHEFRMSESDPARTFSCQYNESDYNYLHRRWEEMGWHYWYEHSLEGHRLVLCDQTTKADMIAGSGEIALHHSGGSNKSDKISNWSPLRKIVSGKIAISHFDFKKPMAQRVVQTSNNEQGDIHAIEVHHYDGLYGVSDKKHGEDIAMRRMQQIDAESQQINAKGDSRLVQPGRWFRLKKQSDGLLSHGSMEEFYILSAKHHIDNNYLGSSGNAASYKNSFTCLPRKLPWRPAQGFNSSACIVPGADTAIVVGPVGEEIHTDSYGRIKVQFHWDREGKLDENSSAWVRVQTPWAGKNFGMLSLPRVGSEVMLHFLQGNPDRPVVTGQLYNERHMPPWALPANKTQSGVQTRSSKGGTVANANVLRFEDKKGAEEILLHAEKNQRIEVEQDESHSVGHNRKKTVGNTETVLIKRNRIATVGVAYNLNVGVVMATLVGMTQTTKVGKTINVAAGESIELVCGNSKIMLTPDAVYIEGDQIHVKAATKVNIDGPDDVLLNSGTAKGAPDTPATPVTPDAETGAQ